MQRALNDSSEQTSQDTLSQGGPPGILRPNSEAPLVLSPALREIWEVETRKEIQHHLEKQKGHYEHLLATAKDLEAQRLQQMVNSLRNQFGEVNKELQRVMSICQQTLSENRRLWEDTEKYEVEIRGFIAERKKIEASRDFLVQENTKLLEELKKNRTYTEWLNDGWSTACIQGLKLHGENQKLRQELKDVSIFVHFSTLS